MWILRQAQVGGISWRRGWCWCGWRVASSRFVADETKTGLRSSTGPVESSAEHSTGLGHNCEDVRLQLKEQ